jgi:site-specific recombinase XerD
MAGQESSTRLNNLIEAFFANLRRRNKAAHTLARWRPELRRFAEWAGERPLHEITAADLDAEFLPWWEADFRGRNHRDPSPSSLRAAIQALRSFYAWLEKFDRLRDSDGVPFRNPTAALEAPVIRPAAELDWLRSEEDEKLLAHPMKNEREAILVFLLRMSGLRLDEALTLTNADIDLTGGQIVVRQSKSDAGYRSVPIAPELRPRIDAWLDFVRRQGWYAPRGPFLVTRNGTAMKAQYVEAALERIGARAGLTRRLTPHTLRRTFGCYLLNKGVRLEVVSRLLGHANTAITEKAYARLEDATIRAEMLAVLSA